MIIITGGAGFIGSNLVRAFNGRGESNILLVDNLKRSEKLTNIVDLDFDDYLHKYTFLDLLESGAFNAKDVEACFHLGACSDTTELDGDYMMENNYSYSRGLYKWCSANSIPFIYASSAAVYGKSSVFTESRENERPLNIYGYSKLLFDKYVRRHPSPGQVAGLRYFNVYGPGEVHKGKMASVAYHHYNQLHERGYVELFVGSHGYGNGEQLRDFVYVDDVVAAKMFFFDNKKTSAIVNLGTGKAQSFNQLSLAGVNAWRKANNKNELTLKEAVEQKIIRYVDFPEGLKARYQSYTQADTSNLRGTGFDHPMRPVEQGVADYFAWLDKQASS